VTDDAGATLTMWEVLASTAAIARGAAMLVVSGRAASLAEAIDAPLAAGAGAALSELRCREGNSVDTVITCPACGAMLDAPLLLDELPQAAPTGPVAVGDVTVRAPSTRDLLSVVDAADPAAALRARCIEGPSDWEVNAPPRADLTAAAEELCGAAAVALRAECPDCGAAIVADVDVVDILFARITDDAMAVLRDVGELAAAFGWAESDILALTPVRREHYLTIARSRRGRW
jgi:hypothetical protein